MDPLKRRKERRKRKRKEKKNEKNPKAWGPVLPTEKTKCGS